VVAALEGDVMVLAGEAAGKAKSSHHRLGAGIGETHKLGRGHHLANEFGDGDLALRAESKDRADLLALTGGSIDVGMAMAENRRAIAQAIIDIEIVVQVPDPRAPTSLDIDG